MNRTILVPIDISDSELTQRVIAHVEAEAKIDDAKVHFLTVIPSLPITLHWGWLIQPSSPQWTI